mmetsp:Transcript_22858/g.57805  ORF Transcript_22858/g.57805 Transcript_22858/m.57805 type:complete len:273 (-) Transcript_22858:748-1566(-)
MEAVSPISLSLMFCCSCSEVANSALFSSSVVSNWPSSVSCRWHRSTKSTCSRTRSRNKVQREVPDSALCVSSCSFSTLCVRVAMRLCLVRLFSRRRLTSSTSLPGSISVITPLRKVKVASSSILISPAPFSIRSVVAVVSRLASSIACSIAKMFSLSISALIAFSSASYLATACLSCASSASCFSTLSFKPRSCSADDAIFSSKSSTIRWCSCSDWDSSSLNRQKLISADKLRRKRLGSGLTMSAMEKSDMPTIAASDCNVRKTHKNRLASS